ncbi:hypothetical protein AB1K70_21115 [Bremerella sp. JC770]|uniref:hypothetical protein n=1 Tax=Bremerella sp. JC770 TaxID=3232137 RepID=UPI00345AE953
MLKYADWKNDAVGTIISNRTSPATLHGGSSGVWYWIEFDELQLDYPDELKGKDLT